MTDAPRYLELRCPDCGWQETCGRTAIYRWLHQAGKLRADRPPEDEILHEVLRATAPQLACPACGRVGLVCGAAADDDDSWPEARRCQSCSKPIPRQRLEAIPGATLCAACQSDEEQGRARTEVEYCPRCGSPMELRLSRTAGITRYVMACTATPPCRGA